MADNLVGGWLKLPEPEDKSLVGGWLRLPTRTESFQLGAFTGIGISGREPRDTRFNNGLDRVAKLRAKGDQHGS